MKYIHCLDPVRSVTLRDLPPFTSDLGILAPTVGDDDSHKKGKKQNASEGEEGRHL